MKKLAMSAISLLIALGCTGAAMAAEATSVTGHLRDAFCYTTTGAMGPSHHDCAVVCAKAGIPVMLVEDKSDQAYVLLPAKDRQGLPSGLVDKMEDEVTITGRAYTKNGINYFQVESVK